MMTTPDAALASPLRSALVAEIRAVRREVLAHEKPDSWAALLADGLGQMRGLARAINILDELAGPLTSPPIPS